MLTTFASFLHLPASAVVSALLLVGKATALLLLALGVTWVMQRTSAVSRHLVWFASLAAILIIPLVVALSPITVPILPAISPFATTTRDVPNNDAPTDLSLRGSTTSQNSRTAAPDAARSSDAKGTAATAGAVTSSATTSASLPSLGTWIVGIWAAIAAALTAWLLMGAFAVRRIARRATSLRGTTWDTPLFEIADRLSLDDAPRLLLSDDVLMPFACGLTTPTIVLPRSAEQWSADQRSAVLLHEMAHIKRRDLVGHTVGRFACALYWFHPLVWTAAKRLRAESERACDDLALLCGARASDYAEQLLDIVSQVKRNTTPSVAMAMATRSEFEGRMLAILDPALRRVAPRRWQSATLLGSAALIAMTIGVAVPASAVPSDARTVGENARADNMLNASASTMISDVDSVATVRTEQPPVAQPARPASAERPTPTPTPTPLPTVAPVKPARPSTMAQRLPGDEPTDRELGMASLQLIREAIRLAEKDAARGGAKPRSTNTKERDKDSSERASLLVGVLRTDQNNESRRIAAWGLSEFTDTPEVVSALSSALRRDSVAAVREMAAWALGEGNAPKGGIVALRDAVRNDRSTAVQITAIWALGQAVDPLDEASLSEVGRALSSASVRVREMAAWTLGSAAPPTAPRALLSALGDSDASVRLTSAWGTPRDRRCRSGAPA